MSEIVKKQYFTPILETFEMEVGNLVCATVNAPLDPSGDGETTNPGGGPGGAESEGAKHRNLFDYSFDDDEY